MPETYAILWAPPKGDTGAGSDLARRLGPEAADQREEPRLSVRTLERNEVAEIATAPELLAIADAMPTALIKPLAASKGDDGGSLRDRRHERSHA